MTSPACARNTPTQNSPVAPWPRSEVQTAGLPQRPPCPRPRLALPASSLCLSSHLPDLVSQVCPSAGRVHLLEWAANHLLCQPPGLAFHLMALGSAEEAPTAVSPSLSHCCHTPSDTPHVLCHQIHDAHMLLSLCPFNEHSSSTRDHWAHDHTSPELLGELTGYFITMNASTRYSQWGKLTGYFVNNKY